MNKLNPLSGKILYALLFVGIIPILLWLWAERTESVINYPPVKSSFWGIAIMVAGGLLMIWGMLALMTFGKGLPMNPYPPERFVYKGPYRLVGHPIYWGCGILMCGISILTGSASGLWLVTPVTILAMIALVWGFENIDLKRRFPGVKTQTWLSISRKESQPPSLRDRLSAIFLIIPLLLTGNLVVGFLEGGTVPLFGGSWNIHPLFEWPWFWIFSVLFVTGVPVFLNRQDRIREWTLSIWIAFALSIYISLLWPAVGAQYFFTGHTPDGAGLTLKFLLGSVPLFLILLSLRAYVQQFRRFALLFYALAIFFGLYQLIHSKSSVLHLILALLIFLISAGHTRIWIFLRGLSEKIANSWKEWVFGPVRIINHGFYVSFGAILSVLLAGWMVGKEYTWILLFFALMVITCSALWAQLIEGSEKLKRPFGYYGALVGIIFAGLVVWLMGFNVWIILGVASVLMPWAQAIGRLRCLVNGCCHGSPVDDPMAGIRYFHERSRVCGLSGLKGLYLHPTQLYAIIWLFFLGFIMLALWNNHLPDSFLFGIYLIMSGTGRFVEEAYRGEVQTPVLNKLHLYQWTAIASVLTGIAMTMIPVKAMEVHAVFGWEIIASALLGGVLIFFYMSVDFPRSNARFSRLV